ncbi:MAG: MraY family glycosyltransferase, partial [Verrucomicrobiota bacterium]
MLKTKMEIGLMFFVTAVALVVSLVLIPLIQKHFRSFGWRATGEFHHATGFRVLRFGGLALVGSFAVSFCIISHLLPLSEEERTAYQRIFVAALAMFALGFWDDLKPLGAKRKLIGQILISSAACWAGLHVDKLKNPFTGTIYALEYLGPILAVAWLVFLTNLINLVDGIDGLAGGVALLLMGLLAYVGFKSQMPFLCLCALGVAGSLIGFLWYNFPPAKIYMGDGGAYFLGFLTAGLSLASSHKGTIVAALIAPLFALALPLIDISLAILRRGLKGLPLFRPDRDHLHHRLTGTGFSGTRAVLILYGVSLIFLFLALLAFWSDGRALPILCGVGGLVFLLFFGSFGFGREWFSVRRVVENSLKMRKTTAYALTLGRWLELEAERRGTLDELWEDFTFLAERLHFSEVKWSGDGVEKSWSAVGFINN